MVSEYFLELPLFLKLNAFVSAFEVYECFFSSADETTSYSTYAEQYVTNVCSFNCLKWPGLLCETDVVFYKNLPVALSVIRHLSKSLSFILCLLMTSQGS